MDALDLGHKIAKLRKENRSTQEELARYVGVSVQPVSKWECGGNPDIELLPKIADFFNVSLDCLLSRNYEKSESIEVDIARTINELPNNQRFAKIMDYCWAIQQGFIFHLHDEEHKIETFKEISTETSDSKYIYSRVSYNEGITLMEQIPMFNILIIQG